MSLFKKIMIGVGIFVTAVFALAMIGIWIGFYATSGLAVTIENQLNALRSDDFVTAYSYTSKDFQNVASLNDFKRFVLLYPVLSSNKSISVTQREFKDNEGMVKGTLYSTKGETMPVEYHLVKEEDQWKILSIQLKPTVAGIKITPQKDASKTITSLHEILLPHKFEDKNNKFSINYPADWEYETPEKGMVIFSSKKGTSAYYSTINIQTILTKKIGGRYRSVNELTDSLKKQIETQATDVKFLDEGSVSMPETSHNKLTQGKYLIFSFTYKGERFQQLQFVFLRSDGMVFYTWAYTSFIDQYELDYPIAKAMFNSWSVY